MSHLIVAIDAGTRSLGWAVSRGGVIQEDVIRARGDTWDERARDAVRGVVEVLHHEAETSAPSVGLLLAVEAVEWRAVGGEKSPPTVLRMAELVGRLLGAGQALGWEVRTVRAQDWRRSAGIRRAPRQEMKRVACIVASRLAVREILQPDAAEAYLIAHHVAGLERLKGRETHA